MAEHGIRHSKAGSKAADPSVLQGDTPERALRPSRRHSPSTAAHLGGLSTYASWWRGRGAGSGILRGMDDTASSSRHAVAPRRRGRATASLGATVVLVGAMLAGHGTWAAGAPLPERTVGPGWDWPLAPRPAVVRSFDPPARPWLSGHRGVDLGSAQGAAVSAPEAGTVSFSGWIVDRPVITIDHGSGLRSSFEPVEGLLPVGAAVAKGEQFGALAAPGAAGHCGDRMCLHWGVRRGDDYVDPLAFIEDRRPSVLLPWAGPAGASVREGRP